MPNEIPNINYTLSVSESVPVPVDDTLSVSGEAADAAAVGAALALKLNISDLSTAISVNGQSPDVDGAISVNATQVLMGGTREDTIAEAVAAVETVADAAIPATDIADDLETDSSTKVLSAAQGVALKALVDDKIDTDDIADDLTTDDATKVLSAKQGAALKALVDAKVAAANVIDNLTTDDATKVLSAKQGAALKALIDALTASDSGKVNVSDVANNLDTESEGKVLDARQGRQLKLSLDGKLGTGDVVNNLTQTDSGKVLDARQGTALKALVDAKLAASDVIDNLTTQNSAKALSAKQGYALKALIDSLTSGKISNSGGDFTGTLKFVTEEDYSEAPASTVSHVLMDLRDGSDVARHRIYTLRSAASHMTLIQARNEDVYCNLGVGIDSNGNPIYSVSHPAALRSAAGSVSLADVVLTSGSYTFESIGAGASASNAVTADLGTSNYIVAAECNTGSCTVFITGRASTGFTVNVKNVTNAASTPTVRWAAIKVS